MGAGTAQRRRCGQDDLCHFDVLTRVTPSHPSGGSPSAPSLEALPDHLVHGPQHHRSFLHTPCVLHHQTQGFTSHHFGTTCNGAFESSLPACLSWTAKGGFPVPLVSSWKVLDEVSFARKSGLF
jgi:hypothetical protein